MGGLARETGAKDPETLWVHNPSGVRQEGVFVDELLRQTMEGQKINKPPLAGQFPAPEGGKDRSGQPLRGRE